MSDKKRTADAELLSMSRITRILAELPEETRGRVVQWIGARYAKAVVFQYPDGDKMPSGIGSGPLPAPFQDTVKARLG